MKKIFDMLYETKADFKQCNAISIKFKILLFKVYSSMCQIIMISYNNEA